MEGLLPLALVSAGIGLWLGRARSREQALRSTKAACQGLGVELLDQAVAPRGLTLRRDASGRLRLRHRYAFEFTDDGDRRLPGWTFILGSRPESVHFSFPEGTTVMGPEGRRLRTAPGSAGNIFDLPRGPS
jgi:hypothetical protein